MPAVPIATRLPPGPAIAHKPELPVVRDPWAHAYFRKEGDEILVGPYETSGTHECWDGPPAWDFESELVAPELDRILPHQERAERFPLSRCRASSVLYLGRNPAHT